MSCKSSLFPLIKEISACFFVSLRCFFSFSRIFKQIFVHSRIFCNATRILKPLTCVITKEGIILSVKEHLSHRLDESCVDFAAITRPRNLHFSIDTVNKNKTARNVQILHLPNAPCQRKAITCRRRQTEISSPSDRSLAR